MAEYLSTPPIPNPGIQMSSAASGGLLIYAIAISGLITAAAVYQLVRTRSPLMLSCLIGGVLCVAIEPIWDVIGHLHFSDGNHFAFTMFTQLTYPVRYPWWAVLVYVQFSGISAYAYYWIFTNRPTRRACWLAVIAQFVMNISVELVYIHINAYQYYSDEQPLRLFGYPMWWIFADAGELAAGTLLCYLIPRYGLRGTVLAPVVVVPSMFGAWELWAGWPVYTTINMDIGPVWTNLSALVTAAIALTTIWFIIRQMTAPNPADSLRPPLAHEVLTAHRRHQ